ncbi:MAG TPA: hypothetical protein VM223_07080 [Planctomycetota bacterium]|nr:hypothetical protein [Planctomycetota bacterium]
MSILIPIVNIGGIDDGEHAVCPVTRKQSPRRTEYVSSHLIVDRCDEQFDAIPPLERELGCPAVAAKERRAGFVAAGEDGHGG